MAVADCAGFLTRRPRWHRRPPRRAMHPVTMKLSTATINDTQHEWLKRFAAAVGKGFRRPDQGRDLSGEPARRHSAADRGRRSSPRSRAGCGPPEFLVGVDERYEAMSSPGLFTSRAQTSAPSRIRTVTGLMLGLGANKGLVGAGIFRSGRRRSSPESRSSISPTMRA